MENLEVTNSVKKSTQKHTKAHKSTRKHQKINQNKPKRTNTDKTITEYRNLIDKYDLLIDFNKSMLETLYIALETNRINCKLDKINIENVIEVILKNIDMFYANKTDIITHYNYEKKNCNID